MLLHRAKGLQNKVLTSAKLLGCRGSVAVRTNAADNLFAQFSKNIRDTFVAQEIAGGEPALSCEIIQGIFKKLATNVNVEVAELPPNQDYNGRITPLLSKDKISVHGYRLEIPFNQSNQAHIIKKNDVDKINTLCHEARHFFNLITEPKYPLRMILVNVPKHNAFAGREFYRQILHKDETTLQLGKDSATRLKQHLVEDKAARIEGVQNKINAFFAENECSPDEKIQLLQKWRYGLKTELVAYKDKYTNNLTKGLSFGILMQKMSTGKNFKLEYLDENGESVCVYLSKKASLGKKTRILKSVLDKKGQAAYLSVVHQQGFLPEKLKLVEKTLAEEIRNVRAAQKRLVDSPATFDGKSVASAKTGFFRKIFLSINWQD